MQTAYVGSLVTILILHADSCLDNVDVGHCCGKVLVLLLSLLLPTLSLCGAAVAVVVVEVGHRGKVLVRRCCRCHTELSRHCQAGHGILLVSCHF